jgi:hypothetical protein
MAVEGEVILPHGKGIFSHEKSKWKNHFREPFLTAIMQAEDEQAHSQDELVAPVPHH